MITSIKETFKDFSDFLKSPIDRQANVQTGKQKAKRLFSLLAIDIPIMGILSVIIYTIQKAGLINTEDHKVTQFLEEFPIWLTMLATIVIIPFIEELIFRLYLRFKRNYVAQFIILIASLTGKQNKIKIELYLHKFWNSKYKSIFFLSAIIFGIVHIFNYDLSGSTLYFLPILIAPQIILGLFSGYLRVRYNLILGYFMHALHNAILIIIYLISMNSTVEKLNLKTSTYTLKIEEVSKSQIDVFSSINKDSISFDGTNLKLAIAALLGKDEHLIEDNNPELANEKIKLTFKSKIDNIPNNKKIILKHLSQIYNFKVETKNRLQEMWALDVQDSVKLMRHISKIVSDSSNSTSSPKEIKIENTDLDQIANVLSSSYNKYIINNSNLKGRFNLIISKKDFPDLDNSLSSEYGLSLKKIEKELEYPYIDFLKKE